MILPRLEWLLPQPVPEPPTFAGFGRPVATLLARRGFRDDDQLGRFLHAGEDSLHDISLMADADQALDRIERAIEAGEQIAIWGDYDADGMTAVVVWVLALRALGIEPLRHVPSRLAEGYGLSLGGLERLRAAGATLVITCDCGVANAVEVAAAGQLGMDVIVTDHHLPSGALPRAIAVVDPHRGDCTYPDPDLTGAGIAFKLASALLARRGRQAADLAGVAAIGTIADMAPMTGESRAIVRLGLDELATTSRPGLRALLARSAELPAQPTARDIGFGIAPRINAAGRIADAELAMSLLLEEDPDAAEQIADELEAVHLERRSLTATTSRRLVPWRPRRQGRVPLRWSATRGRRACSAWWRIVWSNRSEGRWRSRLLSTTSFADRCERRPISMSPCRSRRVPDCFSSAGDTHLPEASACGSPIGTGLPLPSRRCRAPSPRIPGVPRNARRP
ncbi:MAG: DHH family phosphoesterase [Chloroflexota bacterium]